MNTLVIPANTTVKLRIDAPSDNTRIIVERYACLSLEYVVAGQHREQRLEVVLHEYASCEQTLAFVTPVEAALVFDYTLNKNSILTLSSKTRLDQASIVRLRTFQRHLEPQAQSDVLCKIVVTEAAQWDYTGTIYIAPGAHGTVAQQMNPCLIGDSGIVKSIPIIEVLAHEVSCKHGAASGKLDEDALRYLGGRGIELFRARQLLVESFLQ